MGLYNLDKIFQPRSIAVVGASRTEGSIGRAVLANLVEGGFDGELYPVNPKYDRLQGLRCHARIADAPSAPELAVIAVPIDKTPPVVEECVESGVKAAVILSAGGREAGAEGRKIEKQIKTRAERGGLRVVGPNCIGIACPQNRVNASFMKHMPPAGRLAFISQSGAICSAMLGLSLRENMGYRYFISIGSMLDVDFGDLVDYAGNDPEVGSVLLYVESLSNFRKFMSAARAVSRMKPVVVLKAGRSEQGAQAASSHTGSMAGDDLIYDAAFRRAGAVRVRTLGDFFDCAELLAKQDPPKGPKITILTNSGGPGVMAADAVSEYGLALAGLSDGAVRDLDAVLPPHWSRGNPVDILGDADAGRYIAALDCIDPEKTDGTLVILNPQAMTEPAEVAAALAEAIRTRGSRVFASWMGGADVEKGTRILNEAGVPTFRTPELAVRAFRYLYDYGRNLEMLQEVPPRIDDDLGFDRGAVKSIIERALKQDKGRIPEHEAKAVLSAYGIPVNPTRFAASKQEAEKTAAELGFPLALKICSADVVHKRRAGGVRLGLESVEDVSGAWEDVHREVGRNRPEADVQGVTLQPMLAPVELELLIGAKKDPNFGPVLMFGWGGVHAEALEDRSLALAPVNRLLARRLMEGTRVHTVLREEEGRGGVDTAALEEIIVRLSHLVVDFPQIAELDINPLAVSGGRPLALDARILLKPAEVAPPRHLSISPYPVRYEERDVHLNGLRLLVRPVKPEDAPLLEDFFDRLSEESLYQRFFSPMKSIPRSMLVRFTQIDYDREVALLAIESGAGEERIAGVARIVGSPGGKGGEFAVVVADPLQGKGIGTELLGRALGIARDLGLEQVWGTALPDNAGMAHLARRLGFEVGRNSSGEYEMKLDLQDA